MAREDTPKLRDEARRCQALEQALRLSEQRFQALAFATEALTWAADAEGQVVADQPSWREFTGQSRAAILGSGWLDAVHPEDRGRIAAQWQEAIARRSFYAAEYRLQRADGVYRWISARAVPILDPAGAIREWLAACIDITDRKQTQQALEEAQRALEAKPEGFGMAERVRLEDEIARGGEALRRQQILFAAFMDHAPAVASVRDPEGRIVFVNQSFEQVYGIRADEVLGHYHLPWLPAAEAEQIAENCRKALAENVPLRTEETTTDPQGKTWHWLSVRFPFQLPGGERFLGSFSLDITDMKRQEIALRESERRLRDAQATARIGSFEEELDTRKLTWSDEEFRLFGFPPDGPAPALETILERILPEDRARFQEAYRQLSRSGQPIELEFRIRHPDGSLRILHEWIRRLPNAQGEPIRLAGTTQDVTQLRATEREVEQLRRLQRHAFEYMVQNVEDYAIYMLDPKGRVMTWNAGAEAISGYGEAEVLGAPLAIFFEAADAAAGKPRQLLERALAEGSVEEDGWRVRKNGERFWAHIAVTAVHDPEQLLGYVIVLRDLTEPRRVEAIQRELAALGKLDRMKDDFLSVISHELRTPLNFITGFASILEDEVSGPLNETQHAYVKKILNGADRMLFHVNNLVEMSRLSAGKLTISPSYTDYAGLISHVLRVLGPLAENKHIALVSDVQVPGEVLLDGQRITQVVSNLVDNAIKFTPDGGSVRVRAYLQEDRLVTEVSDNGIGIAADDLPKLFQRFVQLDMTSTRTVGGTGLGLAICKSIVEAHGGSVGVRSEGLGKGSTFWFTLPLLSEGESV